MKVKRRMLSLLLTFCLALGLVPTVAFAADGDKNIMLGVGNISGWDSTTGYDYIYYGSWNNKSLKWRVLDTKTNMEESKEGDGFFLLSDVALGTGTYGSISFENNNKRPELNKWQGSYAQAWCKDFAGEIGAETNVSDAFTTGELNSILETTKSDDEYTSNNDRYQTTFAASDNILYNEKVFFLSAEEVENTDYGFIDWQSRIALYDGGAESYWLRSPVKSDIYRAGLVELSGRVKEYSAYGSSWTARPAFNLNNNSVLFSSAAANGKPIGGTGNLSPVSDYSGNEWKLTLLDSSRSSFSATVNGQKSVSISAGESVQINYTGAQIGNNEYISVLLCDSDENVLYYGNIAQNSKNGTATLNIPSGLTAGQYTLKVFSEQCNGDYKTDYASSFQNIALNILSQAETPQASFTATGEDSGTLTNVNTSMKYSVDGGTIWNNITDTTVEIIGITAANDVKVYKPGNGTTTTDSAVQTIDITQAAQPTVSGVDCTTSEQNDGEITGVDNTMEYKLSTASEWTDIMGDMITGLVPGTYEVRVQANGTQLASPAATVIIGKHICVAQGDWRYDGTGHWKLCSCGEKMDEASHSGDAATCTSQAVCGVCGQPYGEKNMANHTGSEAWITTETTHTKVWSCCQTVIDEETNHEWENGVCSECGYACQHTADGTGWHSDETNHWNTCECGEKLNEAAHAFAWITDKEATATEAGLRHEECTVCGYEKAAVEIPATGTTEDPSEPPTDTSTSSSDQTGDTTSPETGDNSNIALWMTTMLAVGAGLTGTVVYGRKKKYN